MNAIATEIRLADCVDLLAGFAFKSDRFQGAESGGIPLVKGENIGQGRILWDISRYWPSNENGLDKFRLLPGDVVLAMDRPWVPAGLKWAVIRDGDPDAFLVQRCSRLRSRSPELRQEFLRYVIGSPGFVSYIRPITTGVNVPHISGAQILAYTFRLPPVEQQKRIAGILSAYDDLIENCERRIRVLDEMARSLYREWFVDFRFPGNSVRSESAWEEKPCSSLAQFVNGYAFKPSHWGMDGKPIIKIRELKAGVTSETPRNSGESIPGKYHVGDGHLLFSWSADLDVYLWRGGDGLLNQHLFDVVPVEGLSKDFLFHALREAMPRFRAMSLGATMHHIKRSALDQVSLLVPDKNVAAAFDRIVQPMHQEALALQKRVQNLRATRDLLLPRLLSGQLSVDDAA